MSHPSPAAEDIRRTKALVRAVATELRQSGAPSLETANHAWLESQPQSLWPLLDATVAASAARKRDEALLSAGRWLLANQLELIRYKLEHGHDWARVSNTLDVEFRIEALREALARFGRPEIFNTDQGSQFTSPRFTGVLREAAVRISMDGRGRWMDNVFIERLWRSLKYECVYLRAFETGSELRAGLSRWIGHYNTRRPHSPLAGRAPDEAYRVTDTERLAA